MPTAQKFMSRGVGNGFPFCLTKLNVNDRGDGEPIHAYKALTLTEVSHLWWNIASMTASATSLKDPEGTLEAKLTFADLIDEPNKRVCGGLGTLYESDSDMFSFVGVEVGQPTVYKIYGGDTDNENNFTGDYTVGAVAVAYADHVVQEFKRITYTGLWGFEPVSGTTQTDVNVGGVTLFNFTFEEDVTSIVVSIDSIDFYTY